MLNTHQRDRQQFVVLFLKTLQNTVAGMDFEQEDIVVFHLLQLNSYPNNLILHFLIVPSKLLETHLSVHNVPDEINAPHLQLAQ